MSAVLCMIGESARHGEGSAVPITNQQVLGHAFLREMFDDSYFPDRMVERGRAILLSLCERIEAERPSDLDALYALTQGSTEEFNLLDREFRRPGAGSRRSRASGSATSSASSHRHTSSRTRMRRS
jgi:hypothetical protein